MTAGLDRLPLLDRLEPAARVLLAGAGGGFDLFAGLPLYFHLLDRGKVVALANLTFSNLYGVEGRQLAPSVTEVDADSRRSTPYFPEKFLCQWLRTHGVETTIQCLHRTGVRPLRAAYEAMVREFAPDALVLVDGGTDSLMRGDEAGLGTPFEDLASIAAAHRVEVPTKILLCLGFGVDAYHGVCHAHFLERVADLARTGAFLGAFSLPRDASEVRRYREAYEYVRGRMPEYPSIVTSSILAAIDGDFGDVHRTDRTRGSRLFINPLMSVYWAFEADAVARQCLYLDRIEETEDFGELMLAIEAFRDEHPGRDWTPLPF